MKKKKSQILNIPAIQKEIHEKHQAFTSKYMGAIEKVMADHKLFSDIILARLQPILVILKKEKVIDNSITTDVGPYKKITITKNNYDTYIEIETNGAIIALTGYSYASSFDFDRLYPKHKFYKANDDTFDWVDFSRQLMDYIHSVIYERKEVIETRLTGMFSQEAE